MVNVNFSAGDWIIGTRSKDKIALKAVSELQKHLKLITEKHYNLNSENQSPNIILTHEQREADGFKISIQQDTISLHGYNPRGLLYAVFSFLESIGCRWPSHEHLNVVIPTERVFQLDNAEYEENAYFPERCLIIGHYAFMRDIENWIIWSARNRLNSIYLHVTKEELAIGQAPEHEWKNHEKAALALIEEYGMVIEYGGHGLESFLPRKLFKSLPEAFRYDGKERTKDYNFCTSNDRGMEIMRKNAGKYFLSLSFVDVFHLYPADIPGGGWCECKKCHNLSPSDQALVAINNIAEILYEINPSAQIVSIAYHDTEHVPTIIPKKNVVLLWAPRRRCYAHAINDSKCSVNNKEFAETFISQANHYKSSLPPRIFEYYLDAILFKSLLPPLINVMKQDMIFYREKGARAIQALLTGDREWITPQINAWLFARLSWNPEQELEQLICSFCEAVFDTKDHRLISYYQSLERAFSLALDLVPDQNKLHFESNTMKIFDSPPTDMADPYHAPLEILQKKVRDNETILDLLKEAETCLQAVRTTANLEAWKKEYTHFNLCKAWLEFDLNRVKLYSLASAKTNKNEMKSALKNAQTSLDEVMKWGETHIKDKRFKINFKFIHFIFWQIRLKQISASKIYGRPKRMVIKVKVLIELGYKYLRMKKLY
ncbi:MAG: DUF4838 domain-containing protein [Candidatus Hodarchaeales archaeon]|jgi:hypothetical protein